MQFFNRPVASCEVGRLSISDIVNKKTFIATAYSLKRDHSNIVTPNQEADKIFSTEATYPSKGWDLSVLQVLSIGAG